MKVRENDHSAVFSPYLSLCYTPNMDFLTRYQQGEHEAVWKELTLLGNDLWNEPMYTQATQVAEATMQRVQANIEQVIQNVHQMGLEFASFDDPRPGSLLTSDGKVKHVPLVLQTTDQTEAFQEAEQIIGMRLPIAYQMAVRFFQRVDLRVPRLDESGAHLDAFYFDWGGPDFLAYQHENWLENQEYLQDDFADELEAGLVLEFCPDYLHKDNISGGGGYGILVDSHPLDPVMVFADFQGNFEGKTFMEYLRWCFQYGGFPGHHHMPELLRQQLTQGLVPF